MWKFILTILGGLLGVAVAYVNRPKLMGGLVDPVKDSLTSASVDRNAMQDWLPMALTYGIIGILLGFVLGVLVTGGIAKSRDKG